ncbi:MAG TPA: hypothetical protein VFP78_16275 [Solirubrobacteraceae bacterium]|nr:hypothetical protein [Solirubrobacteraceae bacterium]
MSDFIADLEAELVDAARRRTTRRRRHVARVPRLRPAAVLAVVALAALVVALIAVARGLDNGSRAGDERPSVPPGPGVTLPLPAAQAARACPGVEQRSQRGKVPQSSPLSIFARPRTQQDALPSLDGADSFTWIPAGTIFPGASRRPTPEQFDAELYLVSIAEPRQGGDCDGFLDAVLGVCLVAGSGDAVVKCFSDEEVNAGRAIALTSPGVVHGIAPDGAARVTLHRDGEAVSAGVHENVYEIRVPVAAGDEIRLELERLEECRPSRELLEAVPALRDGAWQTLPAAAGEAMPSAGVRQWARRIETGDELELWAIAHCDSAERACVVPVGGETHEQQLCATAADIRRSGMTWGFPAHGRRAIAGLAPPGTRRVQVVSGGDVHDLSLIGGVFGGLLPPGFAGLNVRFS